MRIRVAVLPHRFGTKGDAMVAWLREYVGRHGFASHGASRYKTHAVHFYFRDAGRAAEFVREFGLRLAGG